jgi:hypothetical protein
MSNGKRFEPHEESCDCELCQEMLREEAELEQALMDFSDFGDHE